MGKLVGVLFSGMLTAASSETVARCSLAYTNFSSQCTDSTKTMTLRELSNVICQAGDCSKLFQEDVKPKCEGDADMKDTLDMFEMLCSPCMEAFLQVDSSCVISKSADDLDISATCSDGPCHTARVVMEKECATLLAQAPVSGLEVQMGAAKVTFALSSSVASLVRSDAKHRRLQGDTMQHGNTNTHNRTFGNTSGFFRNSVREVSAALDHLCSPCLQDMNSLPSVCSFGDGFDPHVHPDQLAEVCEPGPCKSLLDRIARECDSQTEGAKNLVDTVRMVCGHEPCNDALLALPENCTTEDGPDALRACDDNCFSKFSDMVASCPANPEETPMPDIPLTAYKMAIQNLASRLTSCKQWSAPGTSIDFVVSTTAPVTTPEAGTAEQQPEMELSDAMGQVKASVTGIVLSLITLMMN